MMMRPLLAFGLAFGVSCLLGRLLLPLLHKWHVIDHPNVRSSHTKPTPRGGGLAMILAVLVGWAIIAIFMRQAFVSVLPLAGIIGLGLVSWMDDRKGMPASLRLVAQAGAVVLPLLFMPRDQLVFGSLLPLIPDRILAGICWLWFINLFNFMDGIDGIAGGEAASVGLGLALVGMLAGQQEAPVLMALVAAGAACGFLVWNWHPAKMFMGDVGSIPMGYALGWLLIGLAAAGHLFPALILPLYFVADASFTITKRALRREKIWEAHREHLYQVAVQGGRSHARVTSLVIVINIVLIAAAASAVWLGWEALAIAVVPVVALMWIFSHARHEKGEKPAA